MSDDASWKPSPPDPRLFPAEPLDESPYNGWNVNEQKRRWWMLMPKVLWRNSHFGGDRTVWPFIEWQPWSTPRPPSRIQAVPEGDVVPMTQSVLWRLVPWLTALVLWSALSGWLVGKAIGYGKVAILAALTVTVLGVWYCAYKAWYAFLLRQIAPTTIGHTGIFVIQQAIYKTTGANVEPSAISAPTWEYPNFWWKLIDVGSVVFSGSDPDSDKETKRYIVQGISHPERFAALIGTLQIWLEAEQLKGARADTESAKLLRESVDLQRRTLDALLALQRTSGRDEHVSALLEMIAHLQRQVDRLQAELARGGRQSPHPRTRPESHLEDPWPED